MQAHTAVVVGEVAARIFGQQDERTTQYAHKLGLAFQLTNIIRDIGEDARRNRIYLPLEDLAAHDVELLIEYGSAGVGFGLGFAVRTSPGIAPFPGSVGDFYWNGAAGTTFWVDPAERLFAVMMIQSRTQRNLYRALFRDMVYAAITD